MIIFKAFRYRIYPTKEQADLLSIQFGHSRFVYNYFLQARKDYYQEHKNEEKGKRGLKLNDTCSMLTELKQKPGYEWLADAHAQVLQQSLKNLDDAFVNFYQKRRRFPRFKKKTANQSIRYPQDIKARGSFVYAPKVGWIKAVFHRPLEGKIKHLAISKTKTGKYFASLKCEIEIKEEPKAKALPIGIDLGINNFLVTSDGEEIANPRFFSKAEKKIKKLHRVLSRRKDQSNGWYRAKHKLALGYEKVANQRKDFLHKTSRRLVDQHGYIAIENLNISGLLANRKMAKCIADVSWGEFVRQVVYKSAWYGTVADKIGRFEPSSKTCSACGYKIEKLDLSIRSWVCPKCGTKHNRDVNAAKNILAFSMAGAAKRQAGGEGVRLDLVAEQSSMKPEA